MTLTQAKTRGNHTTSERPLAAIYHIRGAVVFFAHCQSPLVEKTYTLVEQCQGAAQWLQTELYMIVNRSRPNAPQTVQQIEHGQPEHAELEPKSSTGMHGSQSKYPFHGSSAEKEKMHVDANLARLWRNGQTVRQ